MGIFYNKDKIQKGNDSNKWAYIATYGKQTLFDDNLGMAIFYEVIDAEKVYQGPHDHLIQFKPTTQPIDFYFLGAWDKEVGGITTEKEFFEYLDTLLNKLNTTNKLN